MNKQSFTHFPLIMSRLINEISPCTTKNKDAMDRLLFEFEIALKLLLRVSYLYCGNTQLLSLGRTLANVDILVVYVLDV